MTLARWIHQLSYRTGDFTLSSGQKSTFYIDLKTTTLHPEGAALIGLSMVAQMRGIAQQLGISQWGGVGGLTLGADPIATAVSLAARQEGVFCPAFIVRKEPKGHGTGRWIEGRENLDPKLPLLVVEDVATTGRSAWLACERLIEEGFKPVAVLSVVDRENGASEVLSEHGIYFGRLVTLSEIQACAGS